MTILLVYPLHATRFGGSKPHVPNWNWNKWMYQTHFQANPCSVKKAIKLVDHRCKVRRGANFWSLKKISWCYDPCQRSSQRGWWILIPQQDKFMFLLSSTYKSEGVAHFDPFMKTSWGYGLDPLDHSPIPYQAPERWWWWWWWWLLLLFSWGVEQRPGWEHVLSFLGGTISYPPIN